MLLYVIVKPKIKTDKTGNIVTNPHEQPPERPRQEVNPLSEIQLSPKEVETVANAMEVISGQRAETAAEDLEERFSGIIPTEKGNRLIAVDRAPGETTDSRYFVRTTLLGEFETSKAIPEEIFDLDPQYHPSIGQVDLYSSIGKVHLFDSPGTRLEEEKDSSAQGASLVLVEEVATFPPNLFSYKDKIDYLKSIGIKDTGRFKRDDVILSETLYDEKEALSLAEIFAPVTLEDKIKMAQNELEAEVPPFARRHVRHIHEALGSQELGDADRQRLLDTGSSIVELVKDHPQNAHGETIVDPSLAETMAHAEGKVRDNPPEAEEVRGLFKGKQRALALEKQQFELGRAIRVSHTNAQTEYANSLRQPPPTGTS